jgi:hypothetical protein
MNTIALLDEAGPLAGGLPLAGGVDESVGGAVSVMTGLFSAFLPLINRLEGRLLTGRTFGSEPSEGFCRDQ